MIKASIIILDYKKAERVVQNIESIRSQKVNFEYEIIVVDNSVDAMNAEILRKIPDIKLLINKKNTGYTIGNNQGVKMSEGEYIFIVNPDIIWKEQDTMQKLVDYLENNPEVGIVAPKQINEDGSNPLTVRNWPRLTAQVSRRTFLRELPYIKDLVAEDEMQDFDYNETQAVPWVQSSFFVLSRKLWNELGGFDEDFKIFMGDTEMCYQTWFTGKKVMYYADTEVMADGKRCSDGSTLSFLNNPVIRIHLKDSLKYQKKHKNKQNPEIN